MGVKRIGWIEVSIHKFLREITSWMNGMSFIFGHYSDIISLICHGSWNYTHGKCAHTHIHDIKSCMQHIKCDDMRMTFVAGILFLPVLTGFCCIVYRSQPKDGRETGEWAMKMLILCDKQSCLQRYHSTWSDDRKTDACWLLCINSIRFTVACCCVRLWPFFYAAMKTFVCNKLHTHELEWHTYLQRKKIPTTPWTTEAQRLWNIWYNFTIK